METSHKNFLLKLKKKSKFDILHNLNGGTAMKLCRVLRFDFSML